jgi:hypothetical protein
MYQRLHIRPDFDMAWIGGKMKYELSQTDIDIISFALKNRIDYLKGLIMLQEDFHKDETTIAYLKAQLRETERVQELTTYQGQSEYLKLKK